MDDCKLCIVQYNNVLCNNIRKLVKFIFLNSHDQYMY